MGSSLRRQISWALDEYRAKPYSLREFLTKKGRWKHHLELMESEEKGVHLRLEKLQIKLVKPPADTWIAYSDVIFHDAYTEFTDFLPRGLVLDIGAQYGDYAVLAAKSYGATVHTFEPLPDNFSVLVQNIELNDLRDRVVAHQASVGDHCGRGRMSFSGAMAVVGGKDSVEIESLTVDSLKMAPEILKIDVEGMEMEVLRGALETLRRSKPKIIIETHSKRLRAQVDSFLKDIGYRCVHINSRHTGEGWMDEKMNRFYLPGN